MRFKLDAEESSDEEIVSQTESKPRDKLAEKVCMCMHACAFVYSCMYACIEYRSLLLRKSLNHAINMQRMYLYTHTYIALIHIPIKNTDRCCSERA